MDESLDFGDIELLLFQRRIEAGDRWTSTLMPGAWFCAVKGGYLNTTDDQIGRQEWRAGDVFTYSLTEPCDSLHVVLQTGMLAGVFIRIVPQACERYIPAGLARLSRRLSDTSDQHLLCRCTEMLDFPRNDPARPAALAARSFAMVEVITRALLALDAGSGDPFEDRIRTIGRHMLANLANVKTAEILAREFGMSVRRLNVGFKATYGMSAHDFLKAQRLQRAMSILRSGNKPVSSVAYEVGYHPAHFSTEFRRAFGCSPSQIAEIRAEPTLKSGM